MQEEYYKVIPYDGDRLFSSKEEMTTFINGAKVPNAEEADGKSFCYLCEDRRAFYPSKSIYFDSVLYSLDTPQILEGAAKREEYITGDSILFIHEIKVFRDGVWIDKEEDAKITVLDSDKDSQDGVLSQGKTINIITKDVRLNDVFLFTTVVEKTNEEGSLYEEFVKTSLNFKNPQWIYGKLHFVVENHMGKDIAYRNVFVRDEQGIVVDSDSKILAVEETFVLSEDNYFAKENQDVQIAPAIVFATKSTYPEIATKMSKIYEKVFIRDKHVQEYAPQFWSELNALSSIDEKIKVAIDFVQKEIYYVFDKDIMDGHEPQSPKTTFRVKQGDCKAKTVLLSAILTDLGVENTIILVNRGYDFFFRHVGASPFNFNHVILKIKKDGEDYFIDTTINDDYGLLENRMTLQFLHYLEIRPNADLATRDPLTYKGYCVEEDVNIDVSGDEAKFSCRYMTRSNGADYIRYKFAHDSKENILKIWNRSAWNSMQLTKNFTEDEIPEHFSQTSLNIESDNTDLNELVVTYEAVIDKATIESGDKRRVVHYWDDENLYDVKNAENKHEDFTAWLDIRSIHRNITVRTDWQIENTKETIKGEMEVKNKYFTYKKNKTLTANEAKVEIDFMPISNTDIPHNEFKEFAEDYKQIEPETGVGIIEDFSSYRKRTGANKMNRFAWILIGAGILMALLVRVLSTINA